MAWPKIGTVTVTNGSDAITGDGTNFVSAVQIGWAFIGPDFRTYEITGVVSDTELTIAPDYQGDTAAGAPYLVMPTMGLARDLASNVQALIGSYQAVQGVFEQGFATTPGLLEALVQLRALPGTAAAPGVSFVGDTDTGFARLASNTVSAIAGGQEIFSWGLSGLGSPRVWVLPDGALGVGTQSSPYGRSLDEHPEGGGVYIHTGKGGSIDVARRGATCIWVNRMETDGALIGFQQEGTSHGTISISNGTVSLNGGHTSRWAQVDEPEILRGTIMSSLDAMSIWRFVRYEDATGAQQRAAYFGDAADGAEIEFAVEGLFYPATVGTETNEQLTRAEVSKHAADRAVTGVFEMFDASDAYRDAVIAMSGDFVIRLKSGQTPQRGDLIESAGDGTGRVQADDVVRSSTVAKVMSNHVVQVYDDGSFLVPAQLMCG